MINKRNISRRNFLGQASCAALGSTAFLSSVLNLGMINTAAARPHILNNENDYKAMVCILLAGGADSFNMLVPTENSEFADYQSIRATLALQQNELLPITPSNTPGRSFGIHGGMSGVQNLFDQGNLSFLSNVGTLIEPINGLNDFNNKRRPLGLYSHADQIMQWQTSVPQSRAAIGVGGRMADMMEDMFGIDGISMNISLAGKNAFQTGNKGSEFSLSNQTTAENIGLRGLDPVLTSGGIFQRSRNQAVNNLVEDVYANIFNQTYSSLTRQTFEGLDLFKSALAQKPTLPTTFSDTRLSQDMRMIAEIISVQQQLGNRRQIFFVTFGGWDHHDNVLMNQSTMLPVLNDAMSEFYTELGNLGKTNEVTTFTISDFGRTLTSNGNGSDHAWGGNQMIMGGAVDGGKIFGDYPMLNLNDSFNIDPRGRFIPTTSVDEFYAEMALWFGASPNDLNYILPNLCNFYSTPANCSDPVPSNYAPIGMFR